MTRLVNTWKKETSSHNVVYIGRMDSFESGGCKSSSIKVYIDLSTTNIVLSLENLTEIEH